MDTAFEYRFIMPVATLGVAILPLITSCSWKGDADFLKKLIVAARAQAVYYPHFLKGARALTEPLTSAEMQVLKLLCHNLSNKEIGEILAVKQPTVKSHVSHILQKLDVSRRSEAKAVAERLGII